ncbi:MAG: outer membrane beta-barrel protein [Muribaculaceae bacterium]|nr:outer membrane beta-barrel protein [Muribaculaceae bacterium]
MKPIFLPFLSLLLSTGLVMAEDGMTVPQSLYIDTQKGVIDVDVEGIIHNYPVTVVADVLSYIPGMRVEDDVLLLGVAERPSIILNGIDRSIDATRTMQLLATIPAYRLEKIEVMYSSATEYHITGPIVNIILTDIANGNEFEGQLRGAYNQSYYASGQAGVSLAYGENDWSVDINYGLTRIKSYDEKRAYSSSLTANYGPNADEICRRYNREWQNTIFAQANWKGLNLSYFTQIDSDIKNNDDTSRGNDYYNDFLTSDRPSGYHTFSLAYEAPFGLKAEFDYTHQSQSISRLLMRNDDNLLSSAEKQSLNRIHAAISQRHIIKSLHITYGASYRNSENHASRHHYPYAITGYDKILTENEATMFAGVGGALPCGFSFEAIARGSYIHNDYLHQWSFLPNLGLTYANSRIGDFQFNFAIDRQKPAYWQYYTVPNYRGILSAVAGNPGISSGLNYSTQLSYLLKNRYSATLYFLYTHHAIDMIPTTNGDDMSILWTADNINFTRRFGIEVIAPFSVGKIWDSSVSGNFYNERFEPKASQHSVESNERWVFSGEFNNALRFRQNSPVAITVNIAGRTRSLIGAAESGGMWRMDAGIKWQFGKKRCCQFDLVVKDIFNTWNAPNDFTINGQQWHITPHGVTRILSLGFSWHI